MALTKIPAGLLDTTAHVNLLDNEKIRLGTNQDLELYHDGSNSYINDVGTGSLYIKATNLTLADAAGEQFLNAYSNAGVVLYHNNVQKIETTAAGASVTGNLAVSGNLTVSGTTTELDTTNLNVTDKNITLNYHASSDTSSSADGAGITIQDAVNASTNATLNWSASNDRFVMSHGLQVTSGNVGIGTTAPDHTLHVLSSSQSMVEFASSNASPKINFARSGAPTAFIQHHEPGASGTGSFRFATGSGHSPTVTMTISEDNKVGIGTDSPNEMLMVRQTSGTTMVKTEVAANSVVGFNIKKTGATTQEWKIVDGQTANGVLEIYDVTDSRSVMAFKGDGKVGIGTSSIDNNAKLHIEDSGYPIINLDRSSSLTTGNHLGYINFQNNGDVYGYMGAWVESASGTDGKLVFATQNGTSLTDKMTINSTGHLTLNPASGFSGLNNSLLGSTNGYMYAMGGTAGLYLADNSALENAIGIRDAGFIDFITGGSGEKMRITSGGSLLVGRTVENSSSSGHRFTNSGFAAHIVANDYPLLLNRLSSDGPLLTFRKDSATVGAVDSYAGIIQFGQGNVNLKFSNAADAIIPANDSGSNNNAAIDLGLAGVRFKDLFLSGTTNTGAVTLASGGVLSQTVVSGGGVYHTINHTGNEAWSWAAQSGQGSNDYLDVGISGGTRVMTWHEDGKVGIGTADPGVALTVQTYTGETDSFVSGLMLTATSTGTTIPGFGPAIQFQGERNNGVVQNTGLIANMADVNSGANISSGLRFYCSTAGVLNERVRMHYDGEVSIGNTVTIGSGSKTFLSVGDGSGNASLTIYTGTSNYGYLNFADGTSGAAADPGYIRYNHNDNTLYTNRVFSGDFNDTSDERLKENIVDLADGSTNIIKQLKPRTFDWKDSDTPNQTGRAGFIAQEIATVLPNEVYGYLDETKSVNVTAIVAHLVKTVQELEARINTLEG